jgi:predicted metal-dependent peptidase
MKPQMKVQAARYGLIKQRPYLATATVRLRMVASEACPHALAASEGWVLYYNPALVEQTELETLVILLRREVERLIRRHARRLKSFPREIAETASAMEIDDDLASEYGERQDWTLPQAMGFEPGRTAEEYAVRLLDLLEQQPPSLSESSGRDGGMEGDSGACAGAGAPEGAPEDDSSSGESGNAGANNASSQHSADGGAGADNASSGCPADSSQQADASSGCPADSSHSSHSSQQQADGGTNASPSAPHGDSVDAQAGDAAAHGDSAAAQAGDAASHAPASPPAGSATTGRPAPWETDEEPVSEVEIDQLIETTLQRAAEYAKSRGAQGASMARRYEAASKNKPIPWQRILARYIARGRVYGMGRLDYSYARPHRRQSVVPDVVLPTLRQPLLDVAVVVDTSGSISDDELGIALREVQAILKRGGVAEMRVVFGDTRIRAEARVRTAAEAIKAFRQVRGGGGTDMGAVVRDVVETSRPKPELVVVITDGETPWGNPPRARIPIVAVITPRGRRNNTPAWVKEVTIDE